MADFIGESNILKGRMMRDYRVAFIKHEFDCVDAGFGEDVTVDVVVRPEDIYFTDDPAKCQFRAKVNSCVFKGVHYEMWVDTDTGYELMIQDYDPYEVGSEVMLYIEPENIQVMRKERTRNVFEGVVKSASEISVADSPVEVANTLEPGTRVRLVVPFESIDLMDNVDDGSFSGEIYSILYKGDHYHIEVKADEGFSVWADTNDIWDKGDLVGIKILDKDIKVETVENESD